MKIDKPQHETYCATVVSIKTINHLLNCDNVVSVPIFGFQAIVGKDTQIGDIGLFFPAETQLSEEYCYFNNLYRHGDRNEDKSAKGYLEDNRRVKAIKFRGNQSNSLFMPLESLDWTGIKVSDLQVGDEFDILNGKDICKKYVRKVKANVGNKQPQAKKFNRVDPEFMPEHFKIDQYYKFVEGLDLETEIIVSQKLHGTSIRIANTKVKRELNFIEKALIKLGVKIQTTEYDMVYGSRKVVKDVNNPNQNHFYGSDLWSAEGKKLDGLVPENYILYAEIIGYTEDGAVIQKDYAYGYEDKTCGIFVYRVAIINNIGLSQDMSWDHMVEFCKNIGVSVVPEVWRGKLKDFEVEDYLDKRLFDEGHRACLALGQPDVVDEGVVIRVDRLLPYCLKAKGSMFLEHETKLIDDEVDDIEADQDALELDL